MEKKYRILRETMGSLKRVREACVRFEELLEGSVCENGDLGEKISDHELGELYLGLSQITRESEICKLVLKESIRTYRTEGELETV